MGSLGFVLGTAAVDHQQVLVDQLQPDMQIGKVKEFHECPPYGSTSAG